ncbi:ABC transporter ATP-binding protein [Gardnerella vaginalis]|uniref:ABC transporter ATP-binding protein n=1 Tax=Gardnerella vaginalis TaxID=2702 RepID=UPI000945A207|nr:ABC transporter ATP-binding protein [Gardnerella vaginalis]AYZ21531.1 ABC transporter ATP-binding protein [Gardnerella vaginalis]OKY55568.1 putative ABC transporter ATP-binding protein [Gardnerella vaginalis]PNL25658.1 ABC transporter ATP-binding protein [Gardnerella vaginalis]PTE04576.1 ABC transporter ATP-binding protein [Gardnerella vaginalis]
MANNKTAHSSKNDSAISWKTLSRLASYVLVYRVKICVIIASIIVSAIVQAASAMFLQSLVDSYILPLVGKHNQDWTPLVRMIILMASVYAVGVFCSWLWSRLVANISESVMRDLRDSMFKHQQKLSLRYLDSQGYGDIMSRYTNDTEVLREAISWAFPDSFSALMSILAAFISIMCLSLPVAVFVAIFTAMLLYLVRFMLKKSGSLFEQFQHALGELNEFVEESATGSKVIKIFNHETDSIEKLDNCIEKVQKISASANSYANNVMPVISNASYLLYVLIALLGAWAASAGLPTLGLSGSSTLTLGTLISLLALSRAFINPIGEITMQANALMMALAGASRIFELLDEKPELDSGSVQLVKVRVLQSAEDLGEKSEFDVLEEVDEQSEGNNIYWAWKRLKQDNGTKAKKCAQNLSEMAQEIVCHAKRDARTSKDGRYTLLRGDVRFTDVVFGYKEDHPVLHDITWFAKPGQKVALVGATGAGKTTIANLLTRFYDIDDGQILYDGIDVRDICKTDLRHAIGTVLQDVNLFTGTIMDNIRYGNLDASDEDCIQAAKLAHADAFISHLPDGYNTQLNNGGEGLSQGQKQLISIARAAVENPPVLILDEATSSIDTHTEELVQRGMDSLMEGRTVFVIAHRLSTVRNSDVIMVLDHGRIIERGSHEELLAKRGEYYQLCTGAAELE